uniref:Complement component 1 Q subcomponent-binding protein, mitochondrial n=1 Tax=Monodelphis domestica TaxID=13616 RepID=F6ZVX5_MONDO
MAPLLLPLLLLRPVTRALRPAALPVLRPAVAATRAFGALLGGGSAGAPGPALPHLLQPRRRAPGLCSCTCGGLHTEGDKAFAEFLMDEIKEERKIQKHKSLPKMSGDWELGVQGTEAKLVRRLAGERWVGLRRLTGPLGERLLAGGGGGGGGAKPSRFFSFPRLPAPLKLKKIFAEILKKNPPKGKKAQEEQEPELTSTPNFVVEVVKDDTKKALVLDCHYPEDEVGQEEEDESDIFSIREVSFQPASDSEWKDTNYTLNTDSLDWALYDHLMDFLADRGVDNKFADELVELSTALEHQEYINFLEDLKGFVKCQ